MDIGRWVGQAKSDIRFLGCAANLEYCKIAFLLFPLELVFPIVVSARASVSCHLLQPYQHDFRTVVPRNMKFKI